MATLVARLAGPLQAWGAETRFRVVTTHDTPTWSGLLGLCRAALGHSRHDDPSEVAWLRQLPMAVRIDQAGHQRLDYHTINPLPHDYLRFDKISQKDLGLVPLGDTNSVKRWLIRNKPPTLTTRRAYLHDAVFVWFIEGDNSTLARLAYALTHPRWALGLGRKSCPPSSPLVLGIHPGELDKAAQTVPVLRHTHDSSPEDQEERALVWLNGTPTITAEATPRVLRDDPAGAHPQDGYTQHSHLATHTSAPILSGTWHALLEWASEYLTQPHEGASR